MKTIFTTNTVLLLLALAFLLFGCSVGDDMEDCGEMRLWVRFDPDMFELPEGEHRIGHIDVYAFDELGRFAARWQGGPYEYRSDSLWRVPFDLMPGTYTFVAWTNAPSGYRTKPDAREWIRGVTEMNRLEFHLDVPPDRSIDTEIPDLHYGRIEGAVYDPSRDTEYIIYLLPDTYRMNVTVEGLEDHGEDFSLSLSDDNTHYDFRNRVLDDYGVYSHVRTPAPGHPLEATFRVLSLTNDHSIERIGIPGNEDRSPILRLFSPTDGREWFAGDVVKMIRSAYAASGNSVDFDKTYRFDIVLSFDANMDVTVTVDGWSYRPNPVEL